ncbi:ABHD11 [Lepeophtheirus salmonis]|uniref:sn-1-specific diacylglycerol lipase ABHD11 n=1 Tax=Lepeophtheirus salmonis TaxID=72036 RepID=A0A7R8CMC6_LEPSM|nr:ABHD11 [Lepeophtheirus salmonis]CAF2865676.1 ABHD11 [Lepeophtheirus salmonis]
MRLDPFSFICGNDELSPLLITHGLLGTSKNWSAITKKIRKRTDRTVVIFDARNHGKSPWTLSLSYEGMVADLRKLYDSLNLRKAILMGHSMGGRTLLGFALVYPELVDKLISVDISQIPLERTKNIILDKYIYVEDSQGVSRWNVNIEALGKDELRNIAEFPKQWIDLKSNVPVLFICGGKSRVSFKKKIMKRFKLNSLSQLLPIFLELVIGYMQKSQMSSQRLF